MEAVASQEAGAKAEEQQEVGATGAETGAAEPEAVETAEATAGATEAGATAGKAEEECRSCSSTPACRRSRNPRSSWIPQKPRTTEALEPYTRAPPQSKSRLHR